MGCVELSNFHFCCAAIFCQPMKKFEFFGATRATRQRHSKTSSTGDEDEMNNDRVDGYCYTLPEFNNRGRSVTPSFLFRNRFYFQLSPHCSKMNKKSTWEVKNIQDF